MNRFSFEYLLSIQIIQISTNIDKFDEKSSGSNSSRSFTIWLSHCTNSSNENLLSNR